MAERLSQEWLVTHYGAPCHGPHRTVRIFGRRMAVHAKAARGFRRINRVFREQVPGYHEDICNDPDTGAYNCRKIAGTSVWSTHAWPISIDLDWQENARDGDKESEMRDRGMPAIRKLESEGLIRWGGRYASPDDMHLEIRLTPAELKARYTWRGTKKKRWWKTHRGGNQ